MKRNSFAKLAIWIDAIGLIFIDNLKICIVYLGKLPKTSRGGGPPI